MGRENKFIITPFGAYHLTEHRFLPTSFCVSPVRFEPRGEIIRVARDSTYLAGPAASRAPIGNT